MPKPRTKKRWSEFSRKEVCNVRNGAVNLKQIFSTITKDCIFVLKIFPFLLNHNADYLTKVVVKGRNSSNTKVSEIMTPAASLVTVTPAHSVLDVMELMVEKNFRHVPVVEGGAMSGMVSIRDVVHVMLKEHREEVGRLNEYIQGTF